MGNKHLIIKIDNSQINLTGNFYLTYDKTNLPKEAFKFKENKPLYWKVEQKQYDTETGTLTVSVLDYNSVEDNSMSSRDLVHPVNILIFERFDWLQLEPLLYMYTVSKLKNIIFNYRDKLLYLGDNRSKQVLALKQDAPNLFFQKREPVRQEREFEVRVKYEDAKFGNEKITFTVHLKPLKLMHPVEINNVSLRPEFEYIKPYFVKRLGKSFLVKINLVLLDNQVHDFVASSNDIDRINGQLIDSIKTESVLNLQHFKNDRQDKTLYSTEELLAHNKELSLLNLPANDILEILIANGKVKNVRQLEYLAKDKQSLNECVLFTVKPIFGFIFNVAKDNSCFVWELLNSHATYVWKTNNATNLMNIFKIVEEAIAAITHNGRDAYKKHYNSLSFPPYDFKVVEHASENLDENERFIEWRNKLEKVIAPQKFPHDV